MSARATARLLRSALALAWNSSDARIKHCMATAALGAVGAALTSAVLPLGLKALVDHFSAPPPASSSAYLWLIAAYAGGYWIARGLNEMRALALAYTDYRLNRNLAAHLLRHLLRLPLSFHLERATGAICETLASGLQAYQLLLSHSTVTVVPIVVEVGAVLLVVTHVGDAGLLSALALGIVGYTAIFAFGMARLMHPARSALVAKANAQGLLADSLLNYETVKYCLAERSVAGRYDAALAEAERRWTSFFGIKARNGLACGAVFCTLLGGTLLYAGSRVVEGTMTVGDLVLINAYLFQIVRPLELLGVAAQDVIRGAAALERLMALLAEPTEAGSARSDAPHPRPSNGHTLAFESVCFGYKPELAVLRDVSFVARPGTITAIVGASGAGKSSIVRLVFRFFEPTAGCIRLNDAPLSSLTPTEIRGAIAIVPQDIVLLDDTLAYNIALGVPDATEEDIARVAHKAGLEATLARLPEGLNTRVGERGLKLSGGERQRIALARALLRGAPILVFDEATSSLDGETERGIIRNVCEGVVYHTIIMIAHRLPAVVHADQILVLDDGRIAEQGTHESLLARNGRYARFWRAHQSPRLGARCDLTAAGRP